MSNKIPNPSGIFKCGDIVSFYTNSFEFGLSELKKRIGDHTTIYKVGSSMMSPIMVIIEIVKEDISTAQLYDEKTGSKLRDEHKVLCQWYSQKTGKFEERWFNESVLDKELTPSNSLDEKIELFNLDANSIQISDKVKVILKTSLWTHSKFDSIKTLFLQKEEQQTSDVNYETSKKFDYLQFTPPAMAVIGIELQDPKLNKYSKKTGNQNRWISDHKIKCMWYDHISGKFSENYFSPDALIQLKVQI